MGTSVCISGYPLAVMMPNSQGGLELGGVRRYFQPTFVLDTKITMKVPTTTGSVTHEGFWVRDFGLYGMSGGPVFGIDGRVIGMQASVTDPRTSTNGKSTITVQNAMVIRSKLISDLLKKNKIRFPKMKRGKNLIITCK